MKVEFLDEAQIELDDTIKYYNNELDDLGFEFLQEVISTISNFSISPCKTPLYLIYKGIYSLIPVVDIKELHPKTKTTVKILIEILKQMPSELPVLNSGF